MLISIFIILTLTVVGSMFHVYFSLAFSMLVGSIVFNYQENELIAVFGFVSSFAAMTIIKLYLGKNLWDGFIDFDTKKFQES